jgi:hypothetical protein
MAGARTRRLIFVRIVEGHVHHKIRRIHMTANELKKRFDCGERCAMAPAFTKIFLMMHTIGEMLDDLSDERIAEVIAMSQSLASTFEKAYLSEMLKGGLKLENMSIGTVASALAAFDLLLGQAEIHAMADVVAKDVMGKTFPKCSGPIQ